MLPQVLASLGCPGWPLPGVVCSVCVLPLRLCLRCRFFHSWCGHPRRLQFPLHQHIPHFYLILAILLLWLCAPAGKSSHPSSANLTATLSLWTHKSVTLPITSWRRGIWREHFFTRPGRHWITVQKQQTFQHRNDICIASVQLLLYWESFSFFENVTNAEIQDATLALAGSCNGTSHIWEFPSSSSCVKCTIGTYLPDISRLITCVCAGECSFHQAARVCKFKYSKLAKKTWWKMLPMPTCSNLEPWKC